MNRPKRLIDGREARSRIRCGNSKFYALIADGVIPPPVKLGSRSLWPEDEIDAVVEKLIAERDSRAA